MPSLVKSIVLLFAIAMLAAESAPADTVAELACHRKTDDFVPENNDRIFLLDLRRQPTGLCSVRLPAAPIVKTLDHCGRPSQSTFEHYTDSLRPDRPTIIYVHGNRYTADDAIEYGMYVYRRTRMRIKHDINWVIWSWPADRDGYLTHDVREKARRTDGQAFLLASVLKNHVANGSPTTLIGFSFGGRVITGSLHALAGGSLRGIVMPGEPTTGGQFAVGLIAPAIERNWLSNRGYHRLATKNMERVTVLYNRRDIALKRYWLIDQVRGQIALGYAGPTKFAPRDDGSKLPVRSRDCTAIVGLRHDEYDYYESRCQGGKEMARLIRETVASRQSARPPIETESMKQVVAPEITPENTPAPSNVIFSRPMLIQSQP